MLCDRILGNLGDRAPANLVEGRAWDRLQIPWTDCDKRFLRKQTLAGRDVGLLLPVAAVLRHGDIIHQDDALLISIDIPAVPVLVVQPESATDFAALAYELGNLHLPIAIDDALIMLPADEASESLLGRLGAPFTTELRRFQPYACRERINVTVAPECRVVRADR